MTGLGPFDLPGKPFLAFYFVLLVMALAASLFIPRWLRPDGRGGAVSDVNHLAYLAGGAPQYVDALIARLYAGGAVAIDRKRGLSFRRPAEADASAAEIALRRLTTPAKYAEVDRQLRDYADLAGEKLVQAGLLLDKGTALQLRIWQSLPLLAAMAIGSIKWEIGVLRDRPVGYLTIFLVVTLAAAFLRFAVLDRRTRAGQAVLEHARRRQERLRRAAPGDEAGMAVALFGTAALAGSAWSDLHGLRRSTASNSDGGSGCGSDGGSGSGCGGGGCGGCGG
jgi:uncharacterized protein (TIGR04222 family)